MNYTKLGRPRNKAGKPKKYNDNNLFLLRKRANISMEEVKNKLGINESAIYRYESGLRKPFIKPLKKCV